MLVPLQASNWSATMNIAWEDGLGHNSEDLAEESEHEHDVPISWQKVGISMPLRIQIYYYHCCLPQRQLLSLAILSSNWLSCIRIDFGTSEASHFNPFRLSKLARVSWLICLSFLVQEGSAQWGQVVKLPCLSHHGKVENWRVVSRCSFFGSNDPVVQRNGTSQASEAAFFQVRHLLSSEMGGLSPMQTKLVMGQ